MIDEQKLRESLSMLHKYGGSSDFTRGWNEAVTAAIEIVKKHAAGPEEPGSCPRCGNDDLAFGHSWPPMQGSVDCHTEGCEIRTIASTEAEAIRRWNAGWWDFKIVDRDDDGNPIYEASGADK